MRENHANPRSVSYDIVILQTTHAVKQTMNWSSCADYFD